MRWRENGIGSVEFFAKIFIATALVCLPALWLDGCRPVDDVRCPNHEARIAALEQRMNAQTITVSWRQHGDTLWVWDKVIIEAHP